MLAKSASWAAKSAIRAIEGTSTMIPTLTLEETGTFSRSSSVRACSKQAFALRRSSIPETIGNMSHNSP